MGADSLGTQHPQKYVFYCLFYSKMEFKSFHNMTLKFLCEQVCLEDASAFLHPFCHAASLDAVFSKIALLGKMQYWSSLPTKLFY